MLSGDRGELSSGSLEIFEEALDLPSAQASLGSLQSSRKRKDARADMDVGGCGKYGRGSMVLPNP